MRLSTFKPYLIVRLLSAFHTGLLSLDLSLSFDISPFAGKNTDSVLLDVCLDLDLDLDIDLDLDMDLDMDLFFGGRRHVFVGKYPLLHLAGSTETKLPNSPQSMLPENMPSRKLAQFCCVLSLAFDSLQYVYSCVIL